jgi:hypothetical protein
MVSSKSSQLDPVSGAGEPAGDCAGVPCLRVRNNNDDSNRDDVDAQNRNRGPHENVRAGRHAR